MRALWWHLALRWPLLLVFVVLYAVARQPTLGWVVVGAVALAGVFAFAEWWARWLWRTRWAERLRPR